MKRLFIIVLALTIFLPVCGSTLVFSMVDMRSHDSGDVGYSAISMSSGKMLSSISQDGTVLMGTTYKHQNKTSSSGMNCCNSDTTNLKIGIWKQRTSEKTIKYIGARQHPAFTHKDYKALVSFCSSPSINSPPNRQSYSNLVGIIKRLN